MTNSKMNNGGVKLLAAAMVLVLAFAGAAAFFTSEEIDGVTSVPTDIKTVEKVKNEAELTAAIGKLSTADVVIELTADFTVSKAIRINSIQNNLTIYGMGKVVTADINATWIGNGSKNIISIDNVADGKIVTIYDVVFDSNGGASGININSDGSLNSTEEVTLNNVTSKNSKGAGVVVNQTNVKMISCTMKEKNLWGGINVDKSGKLQIDTMKNVDIIYSETAASMTVSNEDYIMGVDGKWKEDGKSETNYKAYLSSSAPLVGVLKDLRLTEEVITAYVGFGISEDMDLKDVTIKLETGVSVSVAEGSVFDGTIVKNEKQDTSGQITLSGLKASAGGVTLSTGSVILSGPITFEKAAATIVTGGDVVLENAVIIEPQSPMSDPTITVTGKLTIRGNVILPEKVKLSAVGDNNKIEIESNSTLSVSGELDGNVTNNGTIAITNVNAEIPSSVGGSGNVDTSAVASEGTLSGTYHTTTEFTKNQTITATGDITLVKGTVFTFKGLFIIPEGFTVTIEDGAKLVIATSTGKLENNGTIVIESKASANYSGGDSHDQYVPGTYEGAFVLSDGEVINEGTINLEYTKPETGSVGGWVMNIASGSFTNNGAINVGEDSELAINGYFLNNGTLNLDGEIVVNNDGGIGVNTPEYVPEAEILNAGEIVLSGSTVATEVTIYITALDAIVEFDGMVSKNDAVSIIVSDEKYTDATKVFATTVDSRVKVVFGDMDSINGLNVKLDVFKNESASSMTETKYDKVLLIDGAMSASTKEDVTTPVVAMKIETIGDVMVVGELSMTENVSLKVLGNLSVPGKITYTVKDSEGGISMDADATMTVTGMVSGNDKGIIKAEDAKINGVYYKIDGVSPAPTMHYYTTMSVAAQSGAKTIEVLGTVEVSEDVTIPAKMTLDNTKGTLTVAKDVKLIMAAESKLKNGNTMTVTGGVASGLGILVNGTLYIEDLKGTKAPGMIISDVVKDGTADRTYTNLTVALTTAVSGDVIKLSNNATISKDSTIPAGVTVDTNNKNLTVDTDTTLTIDGVLFISGATGKLILNPEDGSGNIVKKAGAVELNGAVRSIIAISEDLEIAGAYYSITESGKKTYFVEPVANVTSKVTTFDGTATDNSVVEIKTFNDKFQMPDVTFSGNADKKVIVTIKGQVTAKTITLDVAELRIDNNVKFTGTVTNVVGTVSFNGTAVADLVVRSTTKDAAKELTVSGGFDAADKKNTSFSGDVSLSGMTSDVTVIDGNAKVVENSNLGKTTVNGTISVDISKRLTVADMFVFGTVDAADATEAGSAADVVANNVYLGLKKTEVYSTGAAATIDGKFQINGLMYVLDGSVVPADLVEDKKSLQVFVEDKLWMTVYAMGTTTTVSINEIPVDEVDLKGWVDDKGNSVANPIEIKDNKVYASIDYNVYAVSFTICAGIDNVYIDGVLVDTGIFAPEFKVAAGEHTVSYTLANGYSGTATMLVNGEKVTGYKFNASGDFETVSYGITIQGIEKSGYVPESPDTPVQPSEKDDDDMGLTEYLLIVLVILAAILVVVVAIRMMRS